MNSMGRRNAHAMFCVLLLIAQASVSEHGRKLPRTKTSGAWITHPRTFLRLRGGGVPRHAVGEEEGDAERAERSPVIGIPRDFPDIASAVEESQER
jgi:hypothetical protein